jgi:hypothetical protein
MLTLMIISVKYVLMDALNVHLFQQVLLNVQLVHLLYFSLMALNVSLQLQPALSPINSKTLLPGLVETVTLLVQNAMDPYQQTVLFVLAHFH